MGEAAGALEGTDRYTLTAVARSEAFVGLALTSCDRGIRFGEAGGVVMLSTKLHSTKCGSWRERERGGVVVACPSATERPLSSDAGTLTGPPKHNRLPTP